MHCLSNCYAKGLGVRYDIRQAAWYIDLASKTTTLPFSYGPGEKIVAVGPSPLLRGAAQTEETAAEPVKTQVAPLPRGAAQISAEPAYSIEGLRVRADSGDAEAQFRLGLCYKDGQGVERDPERGIELLKKSAQQGYGAALLVLGCCYEKGDGVERDDAEAVWWYILAAEQGDAEAQYRLGQCYEQGRGVERSLKTAKKYYKKAQKRNFLAKGALIAIKMRQKRRKARERER